MVTHFFHYGSNRNSTMIPNMLWHKVKLHFRCSEFVLSFVQYSVVIQEESGAFGEITLKSNWKGMRLSGIMVEMILMYSQRLRSIKLQKTYPEKTFYLAQPSSVDFIQITKRLPSLLVTLDQSGSLLGTFHDCDLLEWDQNRDDIDIMKQMPGFEGVPNSDNSRLSRKLSPKVAYASICVLLTPFWRFMNQN